jgi:hypothetical protein
MPPRASDASTLTHVPETFGASAGVSIEHTREGTPRLVSAGNPPIAVEPIQPCEITQNEQNPTPSLSADPTVSRRTQMPLLPPNPSGPGYHHR